MNKIAELRFLPRHTWPVIDHKILTAEDFYIPMCQDPRDPTGKRQIPLQVRGCRRCIACFPPADIGYFDGLLYARGKTVSEPQAIARVERGKWIADCPFGCGQAQVVSEADHFFLCNSCINEQVGGAIIPCYWPLDEIKSLIEEALLVRPDFSSRNWHVPESVKNLRDENYMYLGVK